MLDISSSTIYEKGKRVVKVLADQELCLPHEWNKKVVREIGAIKPRAEVRKEKAATEWKTLSKINIFDRRERGTMSILFQAGISSMESHKSLG